MAPEIVGREGPLTGQRFAIGLGPLTLGRNADNNVMIASPQASRVHAEVRRAPDGGCVISVPTSFTPTWRRRGSRRLSP